MFSKIADVLMDHDLASFGDSLVNFIFSIALSKISGRFCGVRVRNRVLAEALNRCGLRGFLGGRVDVHVKGNAVEALLAYAWVSGKVSLMDLVNVLASSIPSEGFEDFNVQVEAFSTLLKFVLVKLSEG